MLLVVLGNVVVWVRYSYFEKYPNIHNLFVTRAMGLSYKILTS